MTEHVKTGALGGAALGGTWGAIGLLAAPAGRAAAYLPDAFVYIALGAVIGAAVGLGRELLSR